MGAMNRLIATGAAAYAGLGVIGLAAPSRVPELFGGTADTPDARTEIRAVYGGLPLAFAGALVVLPSAAVPIAVATAGMALGRVASMAVEPEEPTPTMAGFVVVEAVVAAALLAGARQRGRALTEG
jgi:Na+/proline symporter